MPKLSQQKSPSPNVMEAAKKVAEAAFGDSPSPRKLGEAMYDFEMEVRKDESNKQQ